jgi:hypothetical protein
MKKTILGATLALLMAAPLVAAGQPEPDDRGDAREDGKAWLGVSLGRLTPAKRKRYRFPYQYGGVLVTSVAQRSPAMRAGVKKNDVIMRIDGKYVYRPRDIIGIISSRQPGARIKLDIYRWGSWKPIKVTLGSSGRRRPELMSPFERRGGGEAKPPRRRGMGRMGRGRRFMMKLIAEVRALRKEVETLKKQVRELQDKCGVRSDDGGSAAPGPGSEGSGSGSGEPSVPPPAPSHH